MENKSLSEYNQRDIYSLFMELYELKHSSKYAGAGFINNEMQLIRRAIEENGAAQIACAVLNCIESNDRTVNVPYFVAGLKYYLTSYNPYIYLAVKRYGDDKIKKLWTHFILLDSVWFPKPSQKKERDGVFKTLKDWAYEKVNKKKRKTVTKKSVKRKL